MTVGDAAWAGVGSRKTAGDTGPEICAALLSMYASGRSICGIGRASRVCVRLLGGCSVTLRRRHLLAIPLGVVPQGATEANEHRAFIHQGEGRNPTVED